MCGRTCLTLNPDQIVCACKYKILNADEGTNTNQVQGCGNNNEKYLKVKENAKILVKEEILQTETCIKEKIIKENIEDNKNKETVKDDVNKTEGNGTEIKVKDELQETDTKGITENIRKRKEPGDIITCNQKGENSKEITYALPEWRDALNFGCSFLPSYYISPSEVTPVLVSYEHFRKADASKDEKKRPANARVLMPMLWGMIPFWHKGDYRKHGLTTHNCRREHMLESKLYHAPFRRGQRCVVLCEGMYEWQTTKSAKPSERAAYFLHMPQEDGNKIYDKNTWQPNNVKLLKMAGLYDVWQNEDGEHIYSYAIITFETSKTLSWLHHRMPAILETEEQVNDWLDFKRVTDDQALATLRPANGLRWYRVSKLVNNSRNKSDQCNKPYELVQQNPQKPPMNKTMLAWLNIRKRREEWAKMRDSSDDENTDSCVGASSTIGGGGGASTTSESEAENPSKRPRYRDFKKSTKATKDAASTSGTDKSAHKKQ